MTVPKTSSNAHLVGPEQFVRANGTRIVGHDGKPALLRGVGLGNWLLPEGYMWRFPTQAQSPRDIEAQIVRLAGEDYAEHFWKEFRSRYITESDIARIAESGFDHVRLPLNSRVIQNDAGEPVEAGYRHIDDLVEWCGRHGLHVLLDLHGAPGGQTGTNIDDSPHLRPDLFLEPRYRALTLRLWRSVASRYADSRVVAAYDLLNEPLPNEWQHRFPAELASLYRELTDEIRAVDDHHLIMYEGTHWATNWDIFTEVWDSNSALQFHKYWSAPDLASLAPYLAARDRLGLPIYMGEGGENTLEWLYSAFRLYESEEIGWNLWPWKKLDTATSPASATAPTGWDRLLTAMAGRADIGAADARHILDDYLGAIEIEACTWRQDVVDAVMGSEPSVVPAWGFGYRGRGISYGGEVTSEPRARLANFREGDDIPVTFASGLLGPANPFTHNDGKRYSAEELLVVRLDAGQWLEFEFSGSDLAREMMAVNAQGVPLPLVIEKTNRGVRVKVPSDSGTIEFARLVRSDFQTQGERHTHDE